MAPPGATTPPVVYWIQFHHDSPHRCADICPAHDVLRRQDLLAQIIELGFRSTQVLAGLFDCGQSKLGDLLLRPSDLLGGVAAAAEEVTEFAGKPGFRSLQRKDLRFPDELSNDQRALVLQFLD